MLTCGRNGRWQFRRRRVVLDEALSANGQQCEARKVAAAVMKFDPKLTIDDDLRPYPMQDPIYGENLDNYLINAGLPN